MDQWMIRWVCCCSYAVKGPERWFWQTWYAVIMVRRLWFAEQRVWKLHGPNGSLPEARMRPLLRPVWNCKVPPAQEAEVGETAGGVWEVASRLCGHRIVRDLVMESQIGWLHQLMLVSDRPIMVGLIWIALCWSHRYENYTQHHVKWGACARHWTTHP